MRIEDIDPNFKLPDNMPEGIEFKNVWEDPFQIYGIADNGKGDFCRLPRQMLPRCNSTVAYLAELLAGACVRFTTDAEYLAVLWELSSEKIMSHMTPCGKNGMELFEETDSGTRQVSNLVPQLDDTCALRTKQSTLVKLPGGLRSYVLYLPLYNGLKSLMLGFSPDARLLPGRTPRVEKPIVFYGSSITQGGCASKAGSCYTTLLARRLDATQINLGFSGHAKGDDYIAEYIASLDMSVFVYDYDRNAPSVEHLRATHEPFFRIIRQRQPDLPVVLVTRTVVNTDAPTQECREIIRATYDHAVAAGDQNVWFVDGAELFGEKDRDLCTVDGVHPTDIGFLRMADGLEPVLREILYK